MERKDFLNPAGIYRPAPFWSWNDGLRNEELEAQALDMKKRGWGGYFMHSRIGLVTPYLSDEWMDRTRHTVELSAREGLCAYLYDEDKWPSGYAGGLVPRSNPAVRNTALQCHPVPPPEDTNAVLAVFARESGRWVRIDPASVRSGTELAYISQWVEPMGNPWFNGTTYVDLMNPEAFEEFARSTLDPYAALLGTHCGTTIPGCFTDEPAYIFWHARGIHPSNTVPWSPGFRERFTGRWGYDILDRIISVFKREGDFARVRYHFWRTATEMFLDSFSEPYGRWCREHNLELTGHYMCEDTLVDQIQWVGAAMPHYEHMGWPGMDHLGRNIDNIMTAKQVTSVAHQIGKGRALSELYGCSGQNLTFEGRKWIADWHFVHGINLLNPHLALYSMRGERKRDYPPTISFQQPWWRFNNFIADYEARLSYALTRGKRISQVLVIHPIESAWALYEPGDDRRARQLSEWFDQVSRWLLEEHYDYDYADESLLAKYGRLEHDRLFVGEAEYELVVIPPCFTLRRTTVDFLQKWMAAQGAVISMKPVARRIDAETDAWDFVRDTIVVENDRTAFTSVLGELLEPNVRILSPEGYPVAPVWAHQRADGEKDLFFFANTDRTRGYACEILLQGDGAVEEWDPRTGDVHEVAVEVLDDEVVVSRFMEPCGSLLLVMDRSKDAREIHEDDEEFVEEGDEIDLDGSWLSEPRDPNAITLDTVRWRLGDGELQGPDPLWKVLHPVRSHSGTFSLEFCVSVEVVPESDVFLVLETPEAFSVSVNGTDLPQTDCGFWVDTSFRKRSLNGLLRTGENTIVLSGTANPKIELESLYVIGDFGVRTEDNRAFVITSRKSVVLAQNLGEEGFPFFAGTISLTQSFEMNVSGPGRAKLVFDDPQFVVADVWVNGNNAGQVVWSPYEVEIGRFLVDGTNTIRVDLVNSLRNLLGPHHHAFGELLGVGPDSFSDAENWTDVYQFVPFGFGGARVIVQS